MGTKILAVVLMLGAVGMAVPTMLYGMRFSVLFNRGRQQHDLNDQEKRRRNKNGVLFGICLCCVYGLAWRRSLRHLPVLRVRPCLAGGAGL